jgi:hypothetical protein
MGRLLQIWAVAASGLCLGEGEIKKISEGGTALSPECRRMLETALF